jgi:histidinol-phosphate aminotransferase
MEHLVRPNIRELKPYSSARHEYSGHASVYLDANENPFPTGHNRYPDPLQFDLKNKISSIKKVEIDQIFLGNGSDEPIDLLFRIFCQPIEDHVLVLPPTYGMYEVAAQIHDTPIISISLNKEFQPDYDKIMEKASPHSKILFLCSPNNPTGNLLNPLTVERLIQSFPGIVVVDEAYIDFAASSSFTSKIKEYPNLVVLQTLSKAWGLAGLRLGMAFAHPSIINFMNRVKAPYNLSSLTQSTVLDLLDQSPAPYIQSILAERVFLEDSLMSFSFVKKIYPSQANFLLVQCADANRLYNYLLSQGIVIRNRSSVPGCSNCVRITVGTKEENQFLLKALDKFTQL